MELNPDLAAIRKEYTLQSLDLADVASDPFDQFNSWMQAAIRSNLHEPTAMHLATANRAGIPSGRIVLLKNVDAGFVFFTNYNSRKGNELAENPNAAITFYWDLLERQVRIEGRIEKVDTALSDTYYNSRPELSRIGAWASPQSRIIGSREELEQKMQTFKNTFADKPIPRPENWGGYRLIPNWIEFWQGRRSRLHDRICYKLERPGEWDIIRLAP